MSRKFRKWKSLIKRYHKDGFARNLKPTLANYRQTKRFVERLHKEWKDHITLVSIG